MKPALKRAATALAAGLALAPLAFAPATALAAADYWFLGAGQSTYDFVDVSRITETDDGGRLAWTTRVLEGKGTGKHKIKTVLTYATFYCGQDRFQALKTVQYRGDGQMKSNADLPGPLAEVIPGTVGAAEYAFVCAEPFDRASQARDLGDIDPIRTADTLYRTAPSDRRERRSLWP